MCPKMKYIYSTHAQMAILKRAHALWLTHGFRSVYFLRKHRQSNTWYANEFIRDRCASGMRFRHRDTEWISAATLALVRFACQLEPWARRVLARANMARTSRWVPATWLCVEQPGWYMMVSWNRAYRGIHKSAISMGFSILNHPFLDTPSLWKPPHRFFDVSG